MKSRNPDFIDSIEKLIKNSVDSLLPFPAQEGAYALQKTDINKLLGLTSILSLSEDPDELSLSYEIISKLVEGYSEDNEQILSAADLILSRIGNFPGRTLLRERYIDDERKNIPFSLTLERIAREAENSIDHDKILTDFQYKLYSALETQSSVSVSAPTSAGKSFTLNLDLMRRLQSGNEECIVYIVPTRALISEVSARIRKTLRTEGLENIVVRTAPFPIEKATAPKNIIFVLTQERLLSLLKPDNNKQKITSLFIDEAHEIQKGKRGITLQNAIEIALHKHPGTSILFASPLINNPGYFLTLFNRLGNGIFFTEKISPVSQNIILVSEVKNKPKEVFIQIASKTRQLELGARNIGFRFRSGMIKQRASFAIAVTKPNESTIIYANGPSHAEDLAEELYQLLPDVEYSSEVKDFISFIRTEIHLEYPLADYLKKGIAFHYGHIPSIVRTGIENLFKAGDIKYICCTSTLLQGVNLPAKHIIIENPKSGDKAMLRSDFLNLAGRAGRLLHEFHGNIWCLRPNSWDKNSFEGDALQEIKASMSTLMEDGGTLIQKLLNKLEISESEKEFAEAAYGRLYHESQTISHENLTSKYETASNIETLEQNIAQVTSLSITLPLELLEAHRSLRPDHLQSLYNDMVGTLQIEDLALVPPYEKGGKAKMDKAVEIIANAFDWSLNDRYRNLICYLAHSWAFSTPISEILRERVNFIRRGDGQDPTSTIIRNHLKVLEKEVRFNLVKYFSAYEDLLKLALIERGFLSSDIKIAPYHTFLEFGSCNKDELSLMSLGFSRFTALKLSKKINWAGVLDLEDYVSVLNSISLNSLGLPAICVSELKDILGQTH